MATKTKSNERNDVYKAFLIARIEISELFLGVFTQSVKPEEISGRLTEILKDLADRIDKSCCLKDVSNE